MVLKRQGRSDARFPVGTSVLHHGRRARIIGAKWSAVSGWWYEVRFPDNVTHLIPERLVQPTED